jgi:hypothetical protein
MAVACTDPNDLQCSFSSDGPESEVAAPGLGIVSAWNSADDAYESISGTSMSTPHVSGAAALVWSTFPQLANCQLRELLRSSARDLGAAGWDEAYGHGVVDAGQAMQAAAAGNVPPATCSQTGGPVCAILAPEAMILRGSQTFTVFAAASNASIAAVELRVDGASVGVMQEQGSGSYGLDVDTTTLTDGARTFEATCTDTDGLQTVRPRGYIIDNLPDPSAAIVDPQEGATVAGIHRVLVEAASAIGDANLRVEVRVNAGAWVDVTANRDDAGRYYYDWITVAAAEESSVSARATDAGGRADDSVHVTVVGLQSAINRVPNCAPNDSLLACICRVVTERPDIQGLPELPIVPHTPDIIEAEQGARQAGDPVAMPNCR